MTLKPLSRDDYDDCLDLFSKYQVNTRVRAHAKLSSNSNSSSDLGKINNCFDHWPIFSRNDDNTKAIPILYNVKGTENGYKVYLDAVEYKNKLDREKEQKRFEAAKEEFELLLETIETRLESDVQSFRQSILNRQNDIDAIRATSSRIDIRDCVELKLENQQLLKELKNANFEYIRNERHKEFKNIQENMAALIRLFLPLQNIKTLNCDFSRDPFFPKPANVEPTTFIPFMKSFG